MDTSVPGYDLTCFWCFATFFVCRRDYRGQGYCRKVCRKHAGAASHRLSSARYERSLGDEGRQDRRERRLIHAAKGAEAGALPDARSREVANRAESSASSGSCGFWDIATIA